MRTRRADQSCGGARGSDYVGVGAQSHIERALPAVLAGKKAKVIGNPDMPHSWTYTEDMAATLVSAADNPQAWGRAWHARRRRCRTQREALADLAAWRELRHRRSPRCPVGS